MPEDIETTEDEYTTIPISEGIIGMDEHSVIRGVTELYIPNNFKQLFCEITNISHQFQNMKQVLLHVDFVVTGDKSLLKKHYEGKEFWKAYTLKNFFDTVPPFKRRMDYPVPVLGLMLNKYLRIEKVVDTRNEEEVPYDQCIDTVFSFDSIKPKQHLKDEELYIYYHKKTTFIYDELKLNEKYSYDILLNSEGAHFEFGLIPPYGKVLVSKTEAFSNSEIEIATYISTVKPITSKNIPQTLLEKLEKYLPESYKDRTYPTYIKPASTGRGEDILFPPNGTYGTPVITMGDNTNPEDFITEANAGAQWRLGDFDALRFVNTIVIPEQKELDIIIAVQQEHIPSRIYEQLQSMNKYYEDVLINFDIFNLSHNKRRLRVEAEIDGYTSADKRVVFIHGLNSNRKARQQVSLCPRMKRGALISLINPQRATLLAKVFDENTRELILDKTFPVTILPSDQMVWSLRSIKNSKTFNLSKFIASWIYPKDQEGQFDAVRTGAVKYHPNGQCYYDGTSKSLLEHAKAVYEYLSRDVGMVYVHQPFNASRQFDAQRVVLPEQSLKNRAGNCADLTVLMASILEGFGIQSLIFITKDHVFIGWGNPKSIKTMVALEMTLVGQASFEEAMVAGQENIKKYYLMTGAQDIMPMNFMSMARDAWIISLAECRSEGIVGSKQS